MSMDSDGNFVAKPGYRLEKRIIDPANKKKKVVQPASFEEMLDKVTSGQSEFSRSNELIKENPSEFHEDANRLRARIRRSQYGLLDPSGPRMQKWDMTTLFLLIYTAIVTPYEVCMMWAPTQIDLLWWINTVVNALFITDMVFQFFLPYDTKSGRVRSHCRIALHYLLGWFPLDLVSVIPVDTILMGVDTSGGNVDLLKLIRMLRLMRLVKLAKIIKASRIFARWDDALPISYARRELLKWVVYVALLLHWLACALGMLAQLQGSLRSPELEQGLALRLASLDADDGDGGRCYGCIEEQRADLYRQQLGADAADWEQMAQFCAPLAGCLTPCEFDVLAKQNVGGDAYEGIIYAQKAFLAKAETWVCRYSATGVIGQIDTGHGQIWVAAMYVSLIQLGGGVGSIVPENLAEYIFFLVGITMGSVIWAMVVGTICGMMATADPALLEFRQNMDSLTNFFAATDMPLDVRIACKAYYRAKREMQKSKNYDELLLWLSPGLRGQAVLHMCGRALRNVWYLADVKDPEFLVQLAMTLQRQAFPARERIAATDNLKIVTKGIVAKGGELLYGFNFDSWGEDIILHAHVLRDKRSATGLTYVELDMLSRDDLYEVVEQFPIAAACVRDAAVRLALKRTVKLIKAYTDKRQLDKAQETDSASKAKLMLDAAFDQSGLDDTDSGEQRFDDPGKIFSLITGGKFKDVDEDGNLIETVMVEDDGVPAGGGPSPSPPPQMLSPARSMSPVASMGGEGEELVSKAEFQSGMAKLSDEIAALKDSLTQVTGLLKEQARSM